jgi:hypothetical protein
MTRRALPHLIRSALFPPPAGFPISLQSSRHFVHRNVVSNNHVMTFASGKHFWLVDIGHRGLEGNQRVGRKGEFSSAFIPRRQCREFFCPSLL